MRKDCVVSNAQKALLVSAAAALLIGIGVSMSRADLPSAWTVALPVGAILLGLFLISLLLHEPAAEFDKEERSKRTVGMEASGKVQDSQRI